MFWQIVDLFFMEISSSNFSENILKTWRNMFKNQSGLCHVNYTVDEVFNQTA